MLQVYLQPSTSSTVDNSRHYLQLGNITDAVSSFTTLTVRSGSAAVRLHCTIPTWNAATDTCLDLHDLHELKSRALDLIHELLKSFRSLGIVASYSLAPSNSSLCIVSQRPTKVELLEKAEQCSYELKRGKTALFTIEGAPCLVLA